LTSGGNGRDRRKDEDAAGRDSGRYQTFPGPIAIPALHLILVGAGVLAAREQRAIPRLTGQSHQEQGITCLKAL